jgi:hypothetical protein
MSELDIFLGRWILKLLADLQYSFDADMDVNYTHEIDCLEKAKIIVEDVLKSHDVSL